MLEGPLVDWSDPAAIVESRGSSGLAALAPQRPPRADVTISELSVPTGTGAPRLLDAAAMLGAPAGGGSEVTARLYRPAETDPLGGLLHIHAGGFMTGSLELSDAGCQAVCGDVGAVVVSVDYRLAPENPYPAGLLDCYAALCWLADSADSLGIAAERIAVGGASAGGGLAAAAVLLARDLGGPRLCCQVLQIPELDDRLDTPSMRAFTDTPVWDRPSAVWSWKHYLGDLCGGDVPAYAAPARCEDLSGLPPAFVTTMEFDPLRDEGIVYALRLLQAGVSVELHQLPGTFHASSLAPSAAMSRLESSLAADALRRAFSRPPA